MKPVHLNYSSARLTNVFESFSAKSAKFPATALRAETCSLEADRTQTVTLEADCTKTVSGPHENRERGHDFRAVRCRARKK